MSVLRLSVPMTVRQVVGRDIYGKATMSDPIEERCMVVKAIRESQHTTVRADSSASRGYADEFALTNRFLVSADTIVRLDDQITVNGIAIRVKSRHPRHDVWGKLDHYELGGEVWA